MTSSRWSRALAVACVLASGPVWAQAFGQDVVTQVRAPGQPFSLVRGLAEEEVWELSGGTAFAPVVRGESSRTVVGRLDQAQLGASFRLGPSASLQLGLPVWRAVGGSETLQIPAFQASAGPGDLHASLMAKLVPGLFQVHGGLRLVLPLGNATTTLGAGAFAFEPTVSTLVEPLPGWRTGLSVAARLDSTGPRHVELALGTRVGGAWFVAAEVIGRTTFAAPLEPTKSPVEGVLRGGLALGPVDVEAFVGTGLVPGLGASQLRVGVALAFSMARLQGMTPLVSPQRFEPLAVTPDVVASPLPVRVSGVAARSIPMSGSGGEVSGRVLCVAGGGPARWTSGSVRIEFLDCVDLPAGVLSGVLSAEGRGDVALTWPSVSESRLEVAMPVRGRRVWVLRETVLFETASDVLDEAAEAVLQAWVEQVPAEARGTGSIVVRGHADGRGSALANEALSRRRAAAVEQSLQRRGVTAHVALEGRGASSPRALAPNDPAWRANRRVELEWVLERAEPAVRSTPGETVGAAVSHSGTVGMAGVSP